MTENKKMEVECPPPLSSGVCNPDCIGFEFGRYRGLCKLGKAVGSSTPFTHNCKPGPKCVWGRPARTFASRGLWVEISEHGTHTFFDQAEGGDPLDGGENLPKIAALAFISGFDAAKGFPF